MANTITKCTKNGKRLMMLLPGGRVLNTESEMKDAVGKAYTAVDAIRFECAEGAMYRKDIAAKAAVV